MYIFNKNVLFYIRNEYKIYTFKTFILDAINHLTALIIKYNTINKTEYFASLDIYIIKQFNI